MKKYILIIVLFLLSTKVFGQAEKLTQLFNQYQDAQGVTSIKIAKPMFGMLSRLNIQDAELSKIKPLLSKINGLNILIIDKPSFPANLAKENVAPLKKYDDIRNGIMTAVGNLKYTELMTVNSQDSKIKFLASEANDGILNDLLLNISSDNNTILLMMDGKLSMDDLSKLMDETQSMTALSPVASISSTSSSKESVRVVNPFKTIEVSTGVTVEFTQTDKTSVVVDVDQDKQKYVITEVENGTLKVFIRNNGVRNLNLGRLVVKVSSPDLNAITTKSGSFFNSVNSIKAKSFVLRSSSGSKVEASVEVAGNSDLELSSGSNVRLDLKTSSLKIDASSGSYLRLQGGSQKLISSISSGSSIDLGDFPTKELSIVASSGSFAKVNVSEVLEAKVSSASTVHYKGSPKKISSDVSKNTASTLISIN